MIGGVLVSKVLHLAKAMSVTTFIIALMCVALFLMMLQYVRRSSCVKDVCNKIPEISRSVPFVGPVYWYFMAYKNGIWETWEYILNKYPNCFHMWLFSNLWIVISSPKDFEAVFLSDNAIDKGAIYALFGSKSEGIFIAEGENWRKLRSLLNPAFHTKLLAQFLETMVAKADILVKILDTEVGKTIDIGEYAGRWTLDIICGTQMGVKTYELEDNKYDFLDCSAKTTDLILQRMFIPLLHANFIYKSTSLYKQIQALCKPIHNFAKMIITKRKDILEGQVFEQKEKKEQIYLDGVLSFFADADEKSIIRKVTDVLIAGSDTTRVATSYVVLLMGMFPEVQEKVYKEQCEIIEKHTSEVTISSLARMKYLDMVIKEVLRLYTVPGIVRNLSKPVTLENGVTLPSGCSVYLSMYKVHRKPEIWEHPNEFYPEHFLPEKVAARPKYSFIPFSSGPRNCPGMAFAYLSMKTILSYIVRNYRIHTDLKFTDFNHKLCLMLELKNGYPISLSRR